jgi:hypothetical protein
VDVLNIDLLPNIIDMVVIGDRLFSWPILVEGRDGEDTQDFQMDLDDEKMEVEIMGRTKKKAMQRAVLET